MENLSKNIISILLRDGIGVLPTDTLYGLVGSAFSRVAVERIYKVRKRDRRKPFIILISSIKDLQKFSIKLSKRHRLFLGQIWPGPVSVIFSCKSKRFLYLHRGTWSLAFRLPRPSWLRKLLQKTGPLVAPSANTEGRKPAYTIDEAQKYFGESIDFYVNHGIMRSEPSLLVEIKR